MEAAELDERRDLVQVTQVLCITGFLYIVNDLLLELLAPFHCQRMASLVPPVPLVAEKLHHLASDEPDIMQLESGSSSLDEKAFLGSYESFGVRFANIRSGVLFGHYIHQQVLAADAGCYGPEILLLAIGTGELADGDECLLPGGKGSCIASCLISSLLTVLTWPRTE